MAFRLPAELAEALREQAESENADMTDIVERALVAELEAPAGGAAAR